MSKVKCVGIIAEDNSDYESSKILIKRIIKKSNLPFKKAIGNGCGKIRKKAADYAVDLSNRGCNLLILIHDLDRNDFKELNKDLNEALKDSPILKKIVCIPTEEIEAWFMSDPETIKNALKLKRKPKFVGNPETIKSPKEKLGEQIHLCSEKELIYLNTRHNQILSEKISIDLAKNKCKSFKTLHDFVLQHSY